MDQVDWLLQRARRHPLLTPEQEIQLARQIQEWLPLRGNNELTTEEQLICKRGKKAYNTFFVSNIRLVVKAASWYNRNSGSMTPADLISEGMLGLHRAIEKFEPTLGYKFSTYAVWWIRQAISRGICTKASMIYMPDNAQQLAGKARRYIAEQHSLNGAPPSMAEVAEHFKTTVDNIRLYLSHSQFLASLDAPLRGDERDGFSLADVLEDPNSTLQIDETNELEQVIPKTIEGLNNLQQTVIERRYFNPKCDSYATIARDFGVSPETAKKAHDNALRKMRPKLSRFDPRTVQLPEKQCA